jgi:hypothetical protein
VVGFDVLGSWVGGLVTIMTGDSVIVVGLDVLKNFFSVGSYVGGLVVTMMMFNLPLSPALLEANETNEIPNNANATITSGTIIHNTLLRKLMLLWVMLIIIIVPHLEGRRELWSPPIQWVLAMNP